MHSSSLFPRIESEKELEGVGLGQESRQRSIRVVVLRVDNSSPEVVQRI